jgi:hypothetical protein
MPTLTETDKYRDSSPRGAFKVIAIIDLSGL